ncbi:LytTR family DNA-binding domain-containing protein [uncultured Muriicola sp.]|uniref:LytR/AlgR family response regulator transcription factor n=1 Tax=uncultured Muriicola sp. TaxID=1583102 RepID=UPI00260AB8EB|nr:LytTR family DNA-binding domain-containing protein [uncultured Muriicola sp.]
MKTGKFQKSWLRWSLLILAGLLLLVLAKDLLEATLEGYSFYWYESLLFGSFWVLFIPLLLLNGWIAYNKKPRLYLVYALLFTLLHLLLFASAVKVLSSVFLEDTFGIVDVLRGSGPENGVIALFVYGLGNFFFKIYREHRSKKVLYSAEHSSIRVSKAGRHIVLSPKSILCVRSESPYIALITHDGTYLHTASLQSFLEKHALPQFIRIHKSSIVNTDFVKSYLSRGNGDYDVTLEDGSELRLSRNYAKEFLKRMG